GAPISEFNTKKDYVPKGTPESPEAHKYTTLPPAPASSSAVVWQPLCSPSAYHLYGASSTGLPSSIVDPAAPLWLLAPSSPPWPGSPLAPPSSLIPPVPPWSGIDHPAPRDSTPPASPCPSSSIRLRHPSGFSLVLCRSDSNAAFQIHTFALVTGTIGSSSALRTLLVTLAHQLSISGSSTTCSAAVSIPPPWLLPPSAPPWGIVIA
ncbi:hypothetical protein M9458_023341, partial [Cirrhinus mrigala]